MLKIGKLYICEEFFLLLYPDQETAAAAVPISAVAGPSLFRRRTALTAAAVVAADATYWTKKLGKSVSYTDKNTPLLSLNNKEKYVEVLAGDRKGWIIVEDWLGIKEIVV